MDFLNTENSYRPDNIIDLTFQVSDGKAKELYVAKQLELVAITGVKDQPGIYSFFVRETAQSSLVRSHGTELNQMLGQSGPPPPSPGTAPGTDAGPPLFSVE